ncbi:MAG: hypothetical protein V7K21_10525 [Nostoc sp.]|uniref:hypothetical protein n=1 Tax=Nostoc sp. TaxID=1180 RepID=UPI002FF51F8F
MGVYSTHDSSKNISEEVLGFRPTVYISFLPIYNSDEYIQGINSIIKASMMLLTYESGDAVLTRENCKKEEIEPPINGVRVKSS